MFMCLYIYNFIDQNIYKLQKLFTQYIEKVFYCIAINIPW